MFVRQFGHSVIRFSNIQSLRTSNLKCYLCVFNCVKFNQQLSGRFHVWFILNVNCLGKFLILKFSWTEFICWILMFAYLPMQVVIMDYCHFNLVWDLRSFDVTSDTFCLTTHKHSLITWALHSPTDLSAVHRGHWPASKRRDLSFVPLRVLVNVRWL